MDSYLCVANGCLYFLYIPIYVVGMVAHNVLYLAISVQGNGSPYCLVYNYLFHGNVCPYCPVYCFPVVGTVVHTVLYISFTVVKGWSILSCIKLSLSWEWWFILSCLYFSPSWNGGPLCPLYSYLHPRNWWSILFCI